MTRQGMIRYNPDKNCMEIYTDFSADWIEVSDYLLHHLELMVLE